MNRCFLCNNFAFYRLQCFIPVKTSFMSNRLLWPQLSVLKCIYCGLAQPETWLGGALLLSSTYDHGIYIFFGCVFMSMEKCIRKDELYHNGLKLFLKDFLHKNKI